MSEGLFRKKSLDKVTSPEQLNDYIKVANPGIWIILASIIVLLAGVIIWCIFGRLDTKLTVGVYSDEKEVVCFVPEDKISQLKQGMDIYINGESGTIQSISTNPIELTDADSLLLHKAELDSGQWVYVCKIAIDLEPGVYSGSVTLESMTPISFITN